MKLCIRNGITCIAILLPVLLLNSCKQREVSAILFDKPQPEGVRNLSAFPKIFQGVYIDKDSSFLKITQDYLISEDFYLMQIHESELDSMEGEIIYENGKIIYPSLQDTFVAIKVKDSICWKEAVIDTIFSISADNMVRRYKGYLVLNNKYDSSYVVSLLKLEKRKLSLIRIDSKEDFVNLKPIEVTTVTRDSVVEDTVSMRFHLTKNEFKGLVKVRYFSSPMFYYKIK